MRCELQLRKAAIRLCKEDGMRSQGAPWAALEDNEHRMETGCTSIANSGGSDTHEIKSMKRRLNDLERNRSPCGPRRGVKAKDLPHLGRTGPSPAPTNTDETKTNGGRDKGNSKGKGKGEGPAPATRKANAPVSTRLDNIYAYQRNTIFPQQRPDRGFVTCSRSTHA